MSSSSGLSVNDYEVVDEYNVGIAHVKIVRYGAGSYQYLVEELPSRDVENIIAGNIERILNSIPYDTELNDYILTKTIKETLNIRDEDVMKVIYFLRKELKYKKLQVLVDDPYIEDITVVGPGPVWVRHSKVLRRDPEADFIPTNVVLNDMDEVLKYINLLAEKAGKLISKSMPILDANLPESDGGHRIHLVLPEVSLGRPEITIRKKRMYHNLSINSLISDGVIPRAVAEYVRTVMRVRGSIVIVGPPASGKTTLLRALLYEYIPISWKVAIIEDTPEIDPPPRSNWVRYVVPTSFNASNALDQFVLSKAALRASVSRYIVIGETRGAEAQVLVQAMNMGLGGLTTFHGGNPKEAIVRLTSPPINLSPHQIGMFWCFITINFIDDGGSLRRAVVSVDEPIYESESGEVVLNNVYTYGEEVAFDEIIRRSVKLKELKLPIIAVH